MSTTSAPTPWSPINRPAWGRFRLPGKAAAGNAGQLLLAALMIVPLAAGAFVAPAAAHFLLNVNIRTFHVLHEDGRLRILARLPMPYLVADKLGPPDGDGVPKPAPFTNNTIENGNLVHYLDADALRNDPEGLGRLLADGVVLTIGEIPARAEIGRVRAYPAAVQPPFALRREAEKALEGPVYDPNFPIVYVGDVIVDVELTFKISESVSHYRIRSLLDPGLPEQGETANLIIDHGGPAPRIFRIRGLMDDPVNIGRSALKAFWTFTVSGMRHVLEGLDHVLFIFCLVLSATALGALAWRITGFTVGHTMTLSLGFFGYVPGAPWFVPLVETGIAASIIYAALVAVFLRSGKSNIAMTSAIGLLHGLGFSFVLREILKIDGPDVWRNLLAFNVGIEIGQLMLAAGVWLVISYLANRFSSRMATIRTALAAPCVLMAAIWIGERSVQFYSLL